MADRLKVFQVFAQIEGQPKYQFSELLPDLDGAQGGGGSWSIRGGDGVQLYTAVDSIDSDLDGLPDGWPGSPPAPTFLPECIIVDNPPEDATIDFRLRAGNPATARTVHQWMVLGQLLQSGDGWGPYYDVLLYQGNPAEGGSLIYQTQQMPSFDTMPEYQGIEEIPEGNAKNITNYEDLWVRIRIYGTYEEIYPLRIAFGRIALRYPAAPRAAEGPGYTSLWISDVEWTEKILKGSLTITKDFANRSTLKVKLRDDSRSRHFQPGEEVFFFFNSECIFGGKVETVEETYWGDIQANPLIISIECLDWSRILDRFLIQQSWTDSTLEEIVEKMLSDPPASEEGITVGEVPDWTFTKVNFKNNKLTDALRESCQAAGGLTYLIHPFTRVLSIRDRVTFNAPFTIGDTGTQAYRDLTLSRSINQYRNSQTLVGGKATTDPLIDKLIGIGSPADPDDRTRSFPLQYPVAATPTITRVSSGGTRTPQRVGVRGTDKDGDLEIKDGAGNDAWAQWFFSRDEIQITQNSARDAVKNPTLAPDEILEVAYTGLFPLSVSDQNTAGIAERKRIEGGSGVYEAVDEDEKLDSMDIAKERVQRLLDQFGRVPATIRYEIDRPGLEVGHLQAIVLAAHGVDAQYMVEELNIHFPDPELGLYRCMVTALDGETQGGWASYWRKIAAAGRKFSIREDDVVLKLVAVDEDLTITDEVEESVNGSVTIPPWTDDPYSVATFGLAVCSGGTIGRWRFGRSRFGAPHVIP